VGQCKQAKSPHNHPHDTRHLTLILTMAVLQTTTSPLLSRLNPRGLQQPVQPASADERLAQAITRNHPTPAHVYHPLVPLSTTNWRPAALHSQPSSKQTGRMPLHPVCC
jgi:hypothetical protein